MHQTQTEQDSKDTNKIALRLVTSEVPTAFPDDRIEDILKDVSKKAKEYETIDYIYIIDSNRILKGVTSIRELFQHPRDEQVKNIMISNVISAHAHSHQESVARLAIHNNIKAVPIVDSENHFIGILQSDTILNILHEENVEDVLRTAGITPLDSLGKEMLTVSLGTYITKRIPWLIVGTGGGLLVLYFIDVAAPGF